MSIDKRNFALPAIVAVAAIITINAVVGQDGKHPAPFNKVGPHQKIIKTERPVSSTKALQRKSRPAKTVAVTPRPRPGITQTTVKKDGIGQLLRAAEKTEKKPASDKVVFLDEKRIRFVQSSLAKLGFSPGPVDGVFGEQTREAIRQFEGTRNIPVTGEISRALIAALLKKASFANLDLT